MRLKFYKQSVEKFVSRIDPEAFSALGYRIIFPVACHLRFKASATKHSEEFHSRRLKFYKQSTEKFVSRIDPDEVVNQGFFPVQRCLKRGNLLFRMTSP